MLGDFGYVVGPVLLGMLADAAGAQTAVVVAAAGLIITALLFARWAPETYRAKA